MGRCASFHCSYLQFWFVELWQWLTVVIFSSFFFLFLLSLSCESKFSYWTNSISCCLNRSVSVSFCRPHLVLIEELIINRDRYPACYWWWWLVHWVLLGPPNPMNIHSRSWFQGENILTVWCTSIYQHCMLPVDCMTWILQQVWAMTSERVHVDWCRGSSFCPLNDDTNVTVFICVYIILITCPAFWRYVLVCCHQKAGFSRHSRLLVLATTLNARLLLVLPFKHTLFLVFGMFCVCCCCLK